MGNIYTGVHNVQSITINRYTVNGQDGKFVVLNLYIAHRESDGTIQEFALRLFEIPGMTIALDSTSLPLPEITQE